LTKEEATDLERATAGQSNSKLWHSERKWRVTSSRFGEITKITPRRNVEKLCQSIVCPRQLAVPSVVHGKQYESAAIRKFQEQHDVVVKPSGLHVMHELPFLGASPDGIVDDVSIVEVKCPYVGRDMDIKPGKEFPFLQYSADGDIVLNKTSNYYCQVQGQMYISRRQQCYFVVYTHKDLFVSVISLDREFFEGSMLPKLELFFTKYLRPYIAGRF
jgi:putative phage-type endonuclease